MTLWEKYEVNREAFDNGVPVEIDGSTFHVRFAGAENVRYQTSLGVAALKHRALFDDVEANAERISQIEPEITAHAMFQAVVTGWEHVSARDGSPLEFTRENFVDLLLSCPHVFMVLRQAADNFAAYRVKRAEEVAENLGKLPSGPGNGDHGFPDCSPSEMPVEGYRPLTAGP